MEETPPVLLDSRGSCCSPSDHPEPSVLSTNPSPGSSLIPSIPLVSWAPSPTLLGRQQQPQDTLLPWQPATSQPQGSTLAPPRGGTPPPGRRELPLLLLEPSPHPVRKLPWPLLSSPPPNHSYSSGAHPHFPASLYNAGFSSSPPSSLEPHSLPWLSHPPKHRRKLISARPPRPPCSKVHQPHVALVPSNQQHRTLCSLACPLPLKISCALQAGHHSGG